MANKLICFGLAFATPSSSFTVSLDSGSQSLLKRLVAAAHSSGHGTKVCLSIGKSIQQPCIWLIFYVLCIGGWGGCQYYSQSVSSSANRTKFANSIASTISTYGLDGKLDISDGRLPALILIFQVSTLIGYGLSKLRLLEYI